MSSLKYNKKMPGYIYCITNPQYKIDDIYKLGYTAINLPFEDVKKKLLLRYETYFISPECVELFLVNLPVKAEKRLFDLLSSKAIVGFHDVASHPGPNTVFDAIDENIFDKFKFSPGNDHGIGFIIKK